MVSRELETTVEKKEKNVFHNFFGPLRPLTEKIKEPLLWIGTGIVGAICLETTGFFLMSAASNWFSEGLNEPAKIALYGALGLVGFLSGLAVLEKYKHKKLNQINEENINQAKTYFDS